MKDTLDIEILQRWLKIVLGMLPGAECVLLYAPELIHQEKPWSNIPNDKTLTPQFISAFELAYQQQKTCVIEEKQERIWIALPVIIHTDKNASNPILIIEIKHNTASYESLRSICQWAAKWLSELLIQHCFSDLKPDVHPEQLSSPKEKPKQWYLTLLIHFQRHKWASLALIVATILLLWFPVEYRISVPAVIEGKIETPIVAPYDGFITSSFIRAGEQVKQGDLMAELDKKEPQLKVQKLSSQLIEKRNELRSSLARRERAKAQLLKSQVAQIEGDIAEINFVIEQSSIRSPIDGWVISGDISRSIGAHITKGDALFKVAPLHEYRAMLKIAESDIRYIQQGQSAELKLFAFPGNQLGTQLVSVSPNYVEMDESIIYLAEANLLIDDTQHLKPGMEGVAKVSVGHVPLGWQFIRRFYDWFRLSLWRLSI